MRLSSRSGRIVVALAALAALASIAAATAFALRPERSAGTEVTFPRATAELRRRDGVRIRLTVELARTPLQWSQGLMDRRSLGPRAGMLFIFPSPVHGGFWMKNTLIPLSIAFIGADGRIAQIIVMEPCRAEPCRVYVPRKPYVRALEVNKGAFGRWGVRPGDRLVLLRR